MPTPRCLQLHMRPTLRSEPIKLIDEGQITDGPSLMALSFALAFDLPRER